MELPKEEKCVLKKSKSSTQNKLKDKEKGIKIIFRKKIEKLKKMQLELPKEKLSVLKKSKSSNDNKLKDQENGIKIADFKKMNRKIQESATCASKGGKLSSAKIFES